MKMKLKQHLETDLFEVRKNKKTYEITIERNRKEAWNIWINEKQNGLKTFMFGLSKEIEYNEVLNIIQGNLILEIAIHEQEIKDYEEMITQRIKGVYENEEKENNLNKNGRDLVR